MAKSNAQQQSDYRARHLKEVDGHAERALECLAVCYAVTPRALLEGLLRAADSAAVDRPMLVPNGPPDYYEEHLRLAKKIRYAVTTNGCLCRPKT